ncbi:MAG: glycosyltransferase [Candidatus Aegiribacteria sp.]|nr:glycosyltransferase [Candidatus Aegiribacteria sp.]
MRKAGENPGGTEADSGEPVQLNRPSISVLIPFRNEEKYLQEALDSISGQTFSDFEAVLVDDSSTDSSPMIARNCHEDDSRFRVIPCRGRGLVDALNTGLRESRGQWVARMDADDICEPERLERQYGAARERGPFTVVSCRVRSFPDESVSRGFRRYEEWLNGLTEEDEIERNLFVESPIPHPTAFFHRSSVMDAGGYCERELPEDYELWLRLWSRGFRFYRVPDILLRWREREDRHSRVSTTYSMSRFYRLKARYMRRVSCLSGGRVFVAGSGQTARRLGKYMEREGFRIEAFVDPSPERQGQELRNRPVAGPHILESKSGVPVVVASRLPGARTEIRRFLEERGYIEWKSYVVCS